MIFVDRKDAGKKIAEKLLKYKNQNPVIVALPRGGVVLGHEVAKILDAPLDIIVTRKIGAPFQQEFGIGAIAPNGIKTLNQEIINDLKISQSEINKIIEKETVEMNRRIKLYRGNTELPDLSNKIVIVVDDGLATGVTAKAAIMTIKQMNPQKIILAIPVSPPETANKFRNEVDELICLEEPPYFYAVGAFYQNFEQVTDEEVIELLKK